MRCYRGGKKHKFRPRYTEEPNTMLPMLLGSGAKVRGGSDLHDLLTIKIYKGDVCEWCGKIVNNKED